MSDNTDPFASLPDALPSEQDVAPPSVTPAAPPTEQPSPVSHDSDPFASMPDVQPPVSGVGAFARSLERSIAPALGSLPVMGAGAEMGAAGGAAVGSAIPVIGTAAGGLVGGIVGGVAGAIGGSSAISAVQNWGLSKLPDSWQEALGQDDRQQQLDAQQHPTAAFLGGLAPYALTMRPGAIGGAAIPENATTLQRIMANPITARVFGGAAVGGMEIGNEKVEGGNIDWRNVAIATGFGLLFNKPTRFGESLTELGAGPVRALLGSPEAPTVAQAGDAKVMGPGITEDVYMGTHAQDPVAEMTAQDTARGEQAAISAPPAPDLHAAVRRMEPDLFAHYDELAQQRDTFRQWIEEHNNPPPEAIDELATQQQEIQSQLDAHIESQNGYTGGPEARQLRAQLRDIQSQQAELQERQQAFSEGRAVETPELATIRQHLMDIDYQMRDLAPEVAATYRRAAERHGQFEEPETATPEQAVAEQNPAAQPAPDTSAPTEQAAAAAQGVKTPEEEVAFIANDVAQKLIQAGRPADEAEAAGKLLAARYATRAERFGGAIGSARDLYTTEGPAITTPAGGGSKAALGKIKLIEGSKPVITLMKDANASTFIHETGHQWLEEMLRDASHEKAPPELQSDAATVRKWLGAEEGADIKTRQHEKFARGFEQYMREGVAPTRELASVFASFKSWLMSVYQTLKGLGKPINEDIRSVFDRMLSTEPRRTVYAPDRANAQTLAATHMVEAAETEPHEAAAVMDRVNAEKERYLAEQPAEILEELAEASAALSPAEAGSGEAGSGEVVNDSANAGADAAGGAGGAKPGAVVEGGGSARSKGAGVPGRSESGSGPVADPRAGLGKTPGTELAPGPKTLFRSDESSVVDKAGNIRLDNINADTDIKQVIRDAAAANENFIGDTQGRVSDGQVLELAQVLLGRDPDFAFKKNIGEAFSAPEVKAMEMLMVQSATATHEAMVKAGQGTDEDVIAYANARARHQMLQGKFAQATAEAGRAQRAFRRTQSLWSPEAQTADQFLRDATGKTLYQLRQEAVFGAKIDTVQKLSKFMQDAQKRSFGRMVLEYWINGLISGPTTHATYILGNTVLAMQKIGPDTAAAAAIGSIRRALGRESETVRLGEVLAGLKGLGIGYAPALKASIQALESGVTTLLPGEELRKLPPGAKAAFNAFATSQNVATTPFQPGSELAQAAMLDEAAKLSDAFESAFGLIRGIRDGIIAGGKLLGEGGVEGAPLIGARYSNLGYIPDVEIRGVAVLPTGTYVRKSSRGVAAIHSFFRAMNYSVEKNMIAYRTATNEGRVGEAFDARIAEIRQNPSEKVMADARKEATGLTLMDQGSAFTRSLARLTNTEVLGFPIFKFIDPFVSISANIIEKSVLQRTPAGWLSPELRADLLGHNGSVAQDRAQARMLVGTALAFTAGSLAAEGFMTGSGPEDKNEAAVQLMNGIQPHSVRIGNVWYDIHRLGPMGMLMGVGADMYDVAHVASKGDMLHAASMLMHAFTQNVLDESSMRGPAQLIQAIEDPARYGDAYIRNFLSSFVPDSVGMSQIARATDPYARQARTVMDAIKAKIPGLSETLYARRDIWGEPIPSKSALFGKGVTAIYATQVNNDPVNKALLNLGIFPAQVERRIRNVQLDDGQYDDFARIAGRMAKLRLNTIVNSPDYLQWPDPIRRQVITETIAQSREAARGVMMMKYPQIVKAATAARMAKFNGSPD